MQVRLTALNQKLEQHKLTLTLFVLFMFWLLRWVHLPNSLYFFNDIGRDLLVVWQSWQDKKPFLLGPQNSALPFNQPALYFYLLYPAFLLTGMSLYTHTVTFAGVVGGLLLGGLRWLWHHPAWLRLFLTALWFMAIHPEFVSQNRFIWNPSFVPYLVLVAVLTYASLYHRFQSRASSSLPWKTPEVWIWAFGLGTSLAFSYSVAPFALAFLAVIVWQWRWQGIKWLGSLAAVSFVWQLPTLAFELRYNWQLTRAVLWGDKLEQVNLSWTHKLRELLEYFSGSTLQQVNFFFALFILLVLAINAWLIYRHRYQPATARDQLFLTSLTLTLVTLAITLIVPVSVQAHYVFGLFTVLILALASLRPGLLVLTLVLLTFWWLQPVHTNRYLTPAPRTIAQTDACGEIVCSQITQPVYVSVESSRHPYHNGPEWRFVLGKHGCAVKPIETQPQAADSMLVVVDTGTYTHGQTAYNELTLFGPSQETQVYTCPGQVQVHVLER